MALFERHIIGLGIRSHFLSTPNRGRLIQLRATFRRVPLPTLLLWLLLFLMELFVSVYLCDGRLVFTLDDPYIHLAVADHIRAGGYGVNGSEFSSPSSSIVWPYLMALTEALHLGPFGPLLVNAIAASAAIVVFLRVLEIADLVDYQRERRLSVAVAVLAIFATSAIALPMTGMEHSLHVWASIVTFGGLAEAARGRSPTFVHFAALVLLPLVRFEGAAFAVAAIAGFALLNCGRFAASAAAAIFCSLGVYFALMSARGLPLLPSSVLLKSSIAEAAYERSNAFDSILHNLGASLSNPYGCRLALLGAAIACGAWILRFERNVLTVCIAVLAAVCAHLVFGQYDWFHRYEVYILATAALALLYVTAHLKSLLSSSGWTTVKFSVILLITFGSSPYLFAAFETPLASRGIYEQQYQMSVFAQQLYGRPVAVNDLGLVAYKNPHFVLDLWGLGSEKVRKAKLSGHYGPGEMAALADKYNVGLVMIYDSWFPQGVPANWKKVAILHTSPVTAAASDVTFYRTPVADTEEVAAALRAFKSRLPMRDNLEIVAR